MIKKYIGLVILVAAALFCNTGLTRAVGADASASVSAEEKTSTSTDKKLDTASPTLDANVSADVSAKVSPAKTDPASSEESGRVLPTVNKRAAQAKVTVKGWDPDKKEMIEQRINAEAQNNQEIQAVVMDENAMEITYVVPGKLLGFIPWSMAMNVAADAEARVKVRLPWYRFLVKSNLSNTLEDDLNAVFQHNQADLEFIKSASSSQRQLEIFLNISAKMHEMQKSIIGNIRA